MSTDRLTEVLNYLSAMSRDIGALRTEVRATTSAIEVLRTEVSANAAAIEVLRTEVRANAAAIEGLRTEMQTKFDEVNAKLDGVRGDVRHLSRKVEVMNQDLLDLRANQSDLEHRMGELERKQA